LKQPNPSTALARVVVDELSRGGVDLMVISPGSRSAALAIAASEHADLETRVVLDERSAAFHALGRAKATGFPAAVLSTSGTAPANFFPAIVEADMSLTPLVVLSADRPAELRGVGANQTIDQIRLYGNSVRFFSDVEATGSDANLNESWRSTVSEAMTMALGQGDRPGPVHLNLAFREPTVPVSDDGRTQVSEYPFAIDGRAAGAPWMNPAIPAPIPTDLHLAGSSRGLVIAGEGDYDRDGVMKAAESLGWPVLATALSRMRGEPVVSAYHHVLAAGVPEHLIPETVYVIGAVGPSQRLEDLVESAFGRRIRVDGWGRRIDPRNNATDVLHAEPVATLMGAASAKTTSRWVDAWMAAETAVRQAVDQALDNIAVPAGASIVRSLNDVSWGTLVVASSLSIREVDAHLIRRGNVIANRGASGIDGFVSTALGAASTAPRTLAISGDLSLLHDSNGFLCDVVDDLVMVVLDNNGGGLFDTLPPSVHAPFYERLFVTPHGRDIEQLARFHDVSFTTVRTPEEASTESQERLDAGGRHLIRVPIDRGSDLETHEMLDEVSRTAVSLLQA
jgi:2-succinyl-5-enolpyruvyl-6-hydroxy-3-cyclohexene-1-carboxylate synthase